MSSFRLVGLPQGLFAGLFDAGEDELSRVQARRFVADAPHAYPCRVSLVDAEPGEEVLALSFEHQPGGSPYRARGPIFVRRGAVQRVEPVGHIPEYVTRRLISVRGYDARHDITAAEVSEGVNVASVIEAMFSDKKVAYIHLHNAKPGCFSCRLIRADA